MDDKIRNILIKNPEKDVDIDFAQELSANKLVKSDHEMEIDLETLIRDLLTLLILFASLIDTNQSNDQRDT